MFYKQGQRQPLILPDQLFLPDQPFLPDQRL
jgi:hypothetical protein